MTITFVVEKCNCSNPEGSTMVFIRSEAEETIPLPKFWKI
jgi:hypothetical protein